MRWRGCADGPRGRSRAQSIRAGCRRRRARRKNAENLPFLSAFVQVRKKGRKASRTSADGVQTAASVHPDPLRQIGSPHPSTHPVRQNYFLPPASGCLMRTRYGARRLRVACPRPSLCHLFDSLHAHPCACLVTQNRSSVFFHVTQGSKTSHPCIIIGTPHIMARFENPTSRNVRLAPSSPSPGGTAAAQSSSPEPSPSGERSPC